MTAKAIRITAVPRVGYSNSGLQAMHFAERFDDIVWALPAPGEYEGNYEKVRFFALDNAIGRKLIPVRFIRMMFLCWMILRIPLERTRLYFVHSLVFAVPLYLLRRRYCIFIHGSDRRFLTATWARPLVKKAVAVFGVGFELRTPTICVEEIPNIFIPGRRGQIEPVEYDVLFVLRNAPVKNPYYPISLCEHLGSELGLRIGVVGVSPEELPNDERERLARLEADHQHIRYLGRKSYSEVTDLMARSTILMLPSHAEGVPKVVLEAMSQGVSVIANSALTMPREISSKVNFANLDNWPNMRGLICSLKAGDQRAENIRCAHAYLALAETRLLEEYERLYSHHA